MKKHKGRPKPKSIIHTAFLSLRKEVKVFFIFSLLSIILVELILKQFPAPSQTIYRMGDIFVKLCFSVVASTIFFFINQQIPKEQKKIKSYPFVSNRIGKVASEVHLLFNRFGYIGSQEVTLENLRDKLNKINPIEKVEFRNIILHENWRNYLLSLNQTSKNIITELLPLHDHIDTDILQSLLSQNEILASFERCDERIYQQKEWFFLAEPLLELHNVSRICAGLKGKKYKDTHQQYFYRRENSKGLYV